MSQLQDCAVCGERDYEEVNGLYFCSSCQTQSQVEWFSFTACNVLNHGFQKP